MSALCRDALRNDRRGHRRPPPPPSAARLRTQCRHAAANTEALGRAYWVDDFRYDRERVFAVLGVLRSLLGFFFLVGKPLYAFVDELSCHCRRYCKYATDVDIRQNRLVKV